MEYVWVQKQEKIYYVSCLSAPLEFKLPEGRGTVSVLFYFYLHNLRGLN